AVQVRPAVHFALVVPAGEDRAVLRRRQRGLPLHGRPRCGVQLYSRAPGQASVGRADKPDVAMVSSAGADGVATGTAGCPVEKDVAAVGSRLAPTHMPPDAGKGEGKVAGSCTPGALQRRAHVYARPA